MSPALKRVPPLPGTHPYFKGSACVLVLPGNSCKPFFTALSSVSHELVEVYGVIPANSSCMNTGNQQMQRNSLTLRAFSSAGTVLHSWGGWTARVRDSNSLRVSLNTSCELYTQDPFNTSTDKLAPHSACSTHVQSLFSQIKSKIHHNQL